MTIMLTAVGGSVIVALFAVDLFLTVFNYDGFDFIARRYQALCWRLLRALTAPLPRDARHAARSLASAALLPLTVLLWLGGEITGFALVHDGGLVTSGLVSSRGGHPGMGTAFYFSAGAISTLTFGDVLPQSGFYKAAVDVEAILGLTTFTLSLGYVVAAISVLGDLNALHDTVRRHAADLARPSSVLARHFRGGNASQLDSLLQTLSAQLETYDQGLRRYPVVFYFHSRRTRRSIPAVFDSLGRLLAHLRWGLPADDAMVEDPWLVALLDEYLTTVQRLQRSFVGPVPLPPLPAVDRIAFERGYTTGSGEETVVAFRALQQRTREATGLPSIPDADIATAYARFQDWRRFDQRRIVVLERIAGALGYEGVPG